MDLYLLVSLGQTLSSVLLLMPALAIPTLGDVLLPIYSLSTVLELHQHVFRRNLAMLGMIGLSPLWGNHRILLRQEPRRS